MRIALRACRRHYGMVRRLGWLTLVLGGAACAGERPKNLNRDGGQHLADRASSEAGRRDDAGVDGQSATPVILLTGFGPFVGFPVNSSWESIKPLQGQHWGSFEVQTVELPVEWEAGPQQLLAAIEQYQPSIIISAGMTNDGNAQLRLETTAHNWQQGTDNRGEIRSGTPCVAGGPLTYSTRLPLDRLAYALNTSIGVAISDNAGTFLCNDVFYTLMHHVEASATMAGFIHVPPISSQLTISDLTAAWRVVLDVVTTSAARLHQAPAWPVTVHSAPRYTP